MRFTFSALAIFIASIVLVSAAAQAQSNDSSDQAATEQETQASENAETPKKPKLTKDQEELDKQLLGAWAVVTDNIDAEMTDELFLKAIESCETVPQIAQLDPEPGLIEALPKEEKEVRGELIYFRTDQGLQRFETKTGRVVLLPDVQKAESAGGQAVWQVSGQFAEFSIAFASALQGANVLLMVEEDKLYLKCESQPQSGN